MSDTGTVYIFYYRDVESDDENSDDGDYSWGSVATNTFYGISLSKEHVDGYERDVYIVPKDIELKAGETYWVVMAEWSTGDSFGCYSNSGYECFGIFDSQFKALQEKERLEGDESHSVPWNGYFDCLENITVHSAELMP